MGELIAKVRKNKICCALLMTVIQFAVGLLFFEPTEKSDDFDMCCFLYGAFDGNYDYHMLYPHPLLGRLLVCLLRWVPNLPWYAIYMTSMVFISCFCFHYLFISEYGSKPAFGVAYAIVSFLIIYDFFIRFTFTKIAGLVAIAGMLLLSYAIYHRKYMRWIPLAILLLINSLLMRDLATVAVMGLFLSLYGIYFIENRKQIFSSRFLKTTVKIFLLSACILGASRLSAITTQNAYDATEDWRFYMDSNPARAGVYDYGVPSYKDYAEEYEALGVSENDYKMWFVDYNYSDRDVLTIELLQDIASIRSESKKDFWDTVLEGTRYCFINISSQVIMAGFVLAALVFFLFSAKGDLWKGQIILVAMMGGYLYLYLRGRVQSHVDAIIILTGIILLIFTLRPQAVSMKEKIGFSILSLAVGIFAIGWFYEAFAHSSYYYKGSSEFVLSYREQMEQNYDRLSILSKDHDHLYLIGALETGVTYPAFTVTSEVVERDFYGNLFLMNEYSMPTYGYTVKRFFGEGESLYGNIVNNDKVYYCAMDKERDYSETIATYLSEHYQEDTHAKLVKEIDGMMIYRFISRGKVK